MSLLIKNDEAIVTCDLDDRLIKDSNIYIEDGIIMDISKKVYDAEEIIDAKGMWGYPGLINAYHHFYQIFTRNFPQVQNMELFDWLTHLYEIWKNLDEDLIAEKANYEAKNLLSKI